MSISSWVGTVWGLRGAEGAVLARVLAVEGKSLLLTIVGPGGVTPEGVEFLTSNDARRGRVARISSGSLLAHWNRMSGDLGRLMSMPVREPAL
jgi:hypothetical protein